MQRTTKPDRYSAQIRNLVRLLRAKRITLRTFARVVGLIWSIRGNA